MSTNIEDRLTAALHARADLVQPEDLRPADPPATVVPLVRRPATWALTAAAAVAVAALVVAPSLLDGDDGRSEPAPVVPATTTSPEPTSPVTRTATSAGTPDAEVTTSAPLPGASPVVPNGDEVPGGDWPVAYTYPKDYDVDGDGVSDPVVIRTKGAGTLPHGVRRLEAQLSTGGVSAVLLDYDTFDLTAIAPVQLDGDAGDEILYYRGTNDDRATGVLDLAGGALVDLEVPADPGLTFEPDAEFHDRGYFVVDSGLISFRTVEGGFVPGGTNPTMPPYPVDVFQWSLADGELTVEPIGTRCWDGRDDRASSIQPC